MDEQQEQDGRLSTRYAHLYHRAALATKAGFIDASPAAEGNVFSSCVNCDEAVWKNIAEERKPLCPVCWEALQASLRLASRKGFHLGL